MERDRAKDGERGREREIWRVIELKTERGGERGRYGE